MTSSEPADSSRPTDATHRMHKPAAPGPASGPAPPPQDALIGAEVGGCRIESLLGRGAMGAVYRAKQLRLDREVAVKVIRPELLSDPRALKRFEQEARTVGRFNSPHIVMVHDVGFEHGVHFLVMELVRGKNLRDHVRLLAGGRMTVGDALPLLRQAVKGLEEAQRLSVLHRDIKPDNLMLTERGVLKIADFGIAKPVQEDFNLTTTSELIGTPLYMSPEQCHAAPDLDFRSDMYSLGATFYYLLTGEPPIKATSVYELLQTKTKLEHLSLWKALPELDENHPLSRVIERMTELARDDRYASYEALLADLMLVQQGRTMEIQRSRSKQQALKARPRRKGAMVAGVLAVLVLGVAGAFAWQKYGNDQQQHVPEDHGRHLAALRARFAENGPSPALRADVAAVAAGTVLPERDALLADVEVGLQIKDKLQQVRKPASPAPPFTDLREYFVRVDAAAATSGTPGAELQQWRAGAVATARAEGELGAMATSSLESAFAGWQRDRLAAGGDSKQIAALAERLTSIEAARAALLELLPKLDETVQQRLPARELAAARSGLTVEAAPQVVDVSGSLAEIRAEYAVHGPIASLLNRVEALRPTATDQIGQRSSLLDEFQRAARTLEAARGARLAYPTEPQLPFADVANFFGAIDRELQPLRQPEAGLPVWAAKERTELRDEAALQGKVVPRCRSAVQDWQQRRARRPQSAAELTVLQADLTALRDGITKAIELFPGAAAELAALVPADVVASATKDLGVATRRLEWLGGARETARKYGGVTLASWRAQGKQWTADVARLRTGAAEFAADTEVEAELQRLEQPLERWRDADKRVTELGNALGVGDLLAATAPTQKAPAGDEGAGEWRALRDAAAKCLDAFTVLDLKLDFAQALGGLDEASRALAPHRALVPTAPARLERWTVAVQSLQSAASGMVPVTGGRTKQWPDAVAPFFLSRTEATQADFQRFLEDLNTLLSGIADPQAQLEACKAKLGDLVLPANVLAGMLERRTKLRAPAAPIDSVCYHEAAAYARWFQLSLPTEGEWALAAFGDGNRFAFPWGNDWKDEDAFRNISPQSLVDASAGGRSWRSADGPSVHHLAGNVAEWLQPPPGATEGRLAGGRYNDTKQEQRRRAAGEGFHAASLSKQLPGFGFRTILRVRDYLAPHFANGFPQKPR